MYKQVNLETCWKKVAAVKRKQLEVIKGQSTTATIIDRSDQCGEDHQENSDHQRPCVLDKQVSALKQSRGRPRKKRNMAETDLVPGKTMTQSGNGEENYQEMIEWRTVDVLQHEPRLQSFAPMLCCGLPPGNRMLEENEWRIKVKESEEKCSEVTKQLEELRGVMTLDKLPLLAPCKCHFFKSANTEGQATYGDYAAQSSVQTFIRNVRLLRRLKLQRIGDNHDEVQEHLAMVIDFVVELSCQIKPVHLKGRYAEAYVHHAVDFIKDTMPFLHEGNEEKRAFVDNLVAKLVLNLVGKLLYFTPDLNSTPDLNAKPDQDSAQGGLVDKEVILVIMLRLAEYAYIGHRMLLISSQQIAMVLERLQCLDPFDEGFSQIYENLFFVFHLVEALVAVHIASWREENNLGQGILEEWVTYHFHCKTTLEKRPTAWTPQLMIVLDSITEKLLEQLQSPSELEGHNGQDMWQKALAYLLASAAASSLTGM